MASDIDVNVSLEPHLIDELKPIYPILPQDIAQELKEYVSDSPQAIIPYNLLYKISKWTRTEQGTESLRSKSLDPHGYSMIALLAGTTTAPERNFGEYVPPKEPEEIEAERARERKTITALINGMLSVGCVGVGAYWASDKTGWKNEWRVLFSLFSAIVVAVAEAGIYLIWQWRREQSKTPKPKKRRYLAKHKKLDSPAETAKSIDHPEAEVVVNELDESKNNLRQRR